MSPRNRVWWSAEVTDPVTGEQSILHADSEEQLDMQLESLLTAEYPIPIEQGAGSAANAVAVRHVMRLITLLLRASTRLIEVTNQDSQVTRIVIAVSAVPTTEQLADLESRLPNVLVGERWRPSWRSKTNTLVITQDRS